MSESEHENISMVESPMSCSIYKASSSDLVMAKRRSWKKPLGKPNRPLSAYNIFFQLERDRIVSGGIDRSYTKEDVANVRIIPTKEKPRRRQRQSHGKISFMDLARKIGSKWSQLDHSVKKVFEDRAAFEKMRYTKEVELWNKKKIDVKDAPCIEKKPRFTKERKGLKDSVEISNKPPLTNGPSGNMEKNNAAEILQEQENDSQQSHPTRQETEVRSEITSLNLGHSTGQNGINMPYSNFNYDRYNQSAAFVSSTRPNLLHALPFPSQDPYSLLLQNNITTALALLGKTGDRSDTFEQKSAATNTPYALHNNNSPIEHAYRVSQPKYDGTTFPNLALGRLGTYPKYFEEHRGVQALDITGPQRGLRFNRDPMSDSFQKIVQAIQVSQSAAHQVNLSNHFINKIHAQDPIRLSSNSHVMESCPLQNIDRSNRKSSMITAENFVLDDFVSSIQGSFNSNQHIQRDHINVMASNFTKGSVNTSLPDVNFHTKSFQNEDNYQKDAENDSLTEVPCATVTSNCFKMDTKIATNMTERQSLPNQLQHDPHLHQVFQNVVVEEVKSSSSINNNYQPQKEKDIEMQTNIVSGNNAPTSDYNWNQVNFNTPQAQLYAILVHPQQYASINRVGNVQNKDFDTVTSVVPK